MTTITTFGAKFSVKIRMNFLAKGMAKQNFFYFLANIFICAAIYPMDKFLKRMIQSKNSLSLSNVSLLSLLEVARIPGVSFFAFIADKTQKSAYIVTVCVFGYCASIVILLCVPNAIKREGLGASTVLGVGIANFFNAGIFPPLEMLVLHESHRSGNSKRTYGIMRTSSALGIILGHLSNLVSSSEDTKVLDSIKILVFVLYSVLAIATLVTSMMLQNSIDDKTKTSGGARERPGFFKSLYIVLRSEYGAILMVVITQGFHRTSYSSLQSQYLKSLGIKDQNVHLIFMLRVVPEIIFYLFARDVEVVVGCYWMFSLATFSALLHMTPYLFLPANMNKNLSILFYTSVEIFRGLYSCFMSYSCAKITKLLVPEYTRVTAQGLYNMSLLGFGSILSGLVGHYMLGNDADQNYCPNDFRPFFAVNLAVGLAGMLLISFLASRKKKQLSIYDSN